MSKIVSFGEVLLRLSPIGYDRFLQADQFRVEYGGGEANVAVSLAILGEETVFASKLPAHDIGQAAVNALRKYGVDTSNIVRGGEKIGEYFFEKGISERGGQVIYDRENSAFAQAKEGEFDWDTILQDATWFHLTGITPALSESAKNSCFNALKKAKELGITVSFDPNYRSTLWTKEEAAPVLREMTKYADILISNLGQGADIYNIYNESEENTAKILQKEYGCKYVALTNRKAYSAFKNAYSAVLLAEGKMYNSRVHEVEIADRVGAGDAFAAGLIYALRKGYDAQRAIEMATSAGSLKHSINGDINLVSIKEILHIADGNTGGQVRR